MAYITEALRLCAVDCSAGGEKNRCGKKCAATDKTVSRPGRWWRSRSSEILADAVSDGVDTESSSWMRGKGRRERKKKVKEYKEATRILNQAEIQVGAKLSASAEFFFYFWPLKFSFFFFFFFFTL